MRHDSLTRYHCLIAHHVSPVAKGYASVLCLQRTQTLAYNFAPSPPLPPPSFASSLQECEYPPRPGYSSCNDDWVDSVRYAKQQLLL